MVRILVASRRPWAAEALATSSYGTNLDQPLSADTLVSAAVKVVLPWSTCPIVPTFTCGFVRSYFCFAISTDSLEVRGLIHGLLGAPGYPPEGSPTRIPRGGAPTRVQMEPTTGIEPVTFSLPWRCSTD